MNDRIEGPEKTPVALIDLPTFPKGIASLSLPAVAGYLRESFDVRLKDLNFEDAEAVIDSLDGVKACGLKVSAQNYKFAADLTRRLLERDRERMVFWGGEFPTLMPDECLKHATTIVVGPFEVQARKFTEDLRGGRLAPKYDQAGHVDLSSAPLPALDLLAASRYYSFMGQPMETSRGCVYKCTFCMVHTMQKKIGYRPAENMREDLAVHPRRFVNLVDYNLGMDKDHLLALCAELRDSSAWGWMGEMCLESLDDSEVLEALRASRCRIVYCGLESVSKSALKSINKSQNHVSEYRRIIRKAQSYGIEIASGVILGVGAPSEDSIQETIEFFEDCGVIYVKLTFLTFNPGTKVQSSMRRMGTYLTEEFDRFDGHHLTFLKDGLEAAPIYAGAEAAIRRFYSLRSLLRRSRHLRFHPLRRLEYILFSFCYGQAYRRWLEYDLLTPDSGRFEQLLATPFRKGWRMNLGERVLSGLRWLRFFLRARHAG
jgi:radical SAM superfamily enzyme YgiQ (UPF0313 family)